MGKFQQEKHRLHQGQLYIQDGADPALPTRIYVHEVYTELKHVLVFIDQRLEERTYEELFTLLNPAEGSFTWVNDPQEVKIRKREKLIKRLQEPNTFFLSGSVVHRVCRVEVPKGPGSERLYFQRLIPESNDMLRMVAYEENCGLDFFDFSNITGEEATALIMKALDKYQAWFDEQLEIKKKLTAKFGDCVCVYNKKENISAAINVKGDDDWVLLLNFANKIKVPVHTLLREWEPVVLPSKA